MVNKNLKLDREGQDESEKIYTRANHKKNADECGIKTSILKLVT
jgi:hypothetical protein